MSEVEVLAIGPLSPPITGPGLKNKYIRAGLERRGLDVHWVDTLDRRPGTVVDILAGAVSYDRYVLSASTKVRLFVAPLLAARLRDADVHAVLFPAGGEFADELGSLPSPVQDFYVRIFSAFDAIFPQTEELTDELEDVFGDGTYLRTVPNLRPVPESREPNGEGPTGDRNELRLVYVGRIKPSKGLDDAMDACERVRRAGTTVELDIYGHFLPGDTYKRRFLERCDRISGVRFLGKLPNEDVIPTLQEYDAFLFPTFYEGEGFPGVVVEALAAGCPVLASDWKYNDEIITHGVDGILFEPRDVEELAQAITRLSENPVDLEEMKRNAFERSQAYSVDNVVDDVLRYLAEAGWDIPNQQAQQ